MYINTNILQHIQHGISILIFNVLELPFSGHDFLYLPYVQRAVFVFFSVSPLCLSSMASHLSSITLLLSGCQKPHHHCLPQATVIDSLYFCGDAIVLPQDSSVLHTHTHTHTYFKFQFSFKTTLAATIHQSRKTLS